MITTHLLAATALSDKNGLIPQKKYLCSFQLNKEGQVRIITSDDIECFYASIHDFFVDWAQISSLGWANDKDTFQKMLRELQEGS